MAKDEGFSVNKFEELGGSPKLEPGWGFTKEDLEAAGARLVIDVHFEWNKNTPLEVRQVLGQAAGVLHYIANKQIMKQLEFDGLKPTHEREITHGTNYDWTKEILRDSGWRPME